MRFNKEEVLYLGWSNPRLTWSQQYALAAPRKRTGAMHQ